MPARFPDNINNGLRRVVTGISQNGSMQIVEDRRVMGDPRALLLWGGDHPPTTGDPTPPIHSEWWPPAGGIRMSLSTRAPERNNAATPRPPGLPDIDDANGFHSSTSTDVIIVISGEIWFELEDSDEIHLCAGDILIQNGTSHRWRNHGRNGRLWRWLSLVRDSPPDG